MKRSLRKPSSWPSLMLRAGFYIGFANLVVGLTQAKAEVIAFGTHRFENYATEVYTGPLSKPDFQHGRRYTVFRTRITNAAKDGIDFGGHYAIAGAGCGTGCINYFMVDVETGKISKLPFGGEHASLTELLGRPNSLLLKAYWEDYNTNIGVAENDPKKLFICHGEEALFDGEKFKPVWSILKKGNCPWWPGRN